MNFRTTALATTALVAIAAAPASANQYMGKVNLGFGYVWEDYSDGGESNFDFDLNYTALHGSASVNVPYSEWVNLQFDIFGNASMDDEGGEDGGSYYGGFGAGMHINYRDPMVGAVGIFGAVGRVAGGGTSSEDVVVFAAGLEGEYYCNAWTLSAQIGYLDSDPNELDIIKNAGFARVGAAYYASNKLKLAAHVGYLNGDTSNTGPASDFDEWNWAFSIEYLFGKSIPVSTYIEYRGQDVEVFNSPTWNEERHEVRGGVRFLFGGGDDLKKADREGAGMQSPDIITWPRYFNN